MRQIPFATLLFCVLVLAGCAGRTDVIVLDDRLAAVEGQLARQKALIDQFGQTSENKEQNIRGQTATLRVEIDSMREQIGAINGRLEEVEYQIKQGKNAPGSTDASGSTELDRLKEDARVMNSRITSIEQYLDMGGAAKFSSVKPAPTKVPAAKVPLSSLSEQELYDQAKQAFDAGELEKAREGFLSLPSAMRIPQMPTMPSSGSGKFTTEKNGMKKPSSSTRKSSKTTPRATKSGLPC
jgi:TolA-binding protein